MKVILTLLVSVFVVSDVCADRWSRREIRQSRRGGWGWTPVHNYVAAPAEVSSAPVPAPAPAPVPAAPPIAESKDALDEVNAVRARHGLPPFVKDDLLTQAAHKAASIRAANLCTGHLDNDFNCLPPGGQATSAGCAAWEPSWGWGSCCTTDSYTYAGAAWVMGRDGRRYMHLFVR